MLRYVSTPGNPKNVTPAEVIAYKQAGIGLGIVFESVADRVLGGRANGEADARLARDQLTALKMHSAPCYFAVDFDLRGAYQLVQLKEYLHGACAVLGHGRVGIYGGYVPVHFARKNKLCSWFWQTSAWSYGKVDSHIHVLQYDTQTVAGIPCDLDRTFQVDWGQWPRPTKKGTRIGKHLRRVVPHLVVRWHRIRRPRRPIVGS